ncbi:sensor histidine kinase, partial [Klebsiella pneumoniae]
MTAPASIALALAASVAGLLVGFLVGRSRLTHSRMRPQGPTAAQLLERFVRSSNSGVLILNRFGDLVLHNHRAEELGLVRDNRADARARKAAEQVVDGGTPTEVDLS